MTNNNTQPSQQVPCPDCHAGAACFVHDAQQVPVVMTDELAAFEKFYAAGFPFTGIDSKFKFDSLSKGIMFEAWQARAALAQSPAASDAGLADDAKRWRAFMKALRTRIAGPGHGRRIKVVEVCPMYGDETEVSDIQSVIDAAIASQEPQHG